ARRRILDSFPTRRSSDVDLSIGTVMAFSGVMTAVIITDWELPVAVGMLGGIATGALAGLINGVLIARMRVPPFIATLGMLYVAKDRKSTRLNSSHVKISY